MKIKHLKNNGIGPIIEGKKTNIRDLNGKKTRSYVEKLGEKMIKIHNLLPGVT